MSRLALFAPLLLAIAGSVVYHVAAKSIPKAFDPVAALIGLYATALAGSVLVYAIVRPKSQAMGPLRLWHPTIAAVGLGALMIELGFLSAYRSAWPVSTASVATNGLVAVVLVVVGGLAFGEALSTLKVVGVLFCLVGVALLQR
jgi:multidrug transporter EmrE-like cation transporter